MAAQSYIIEIKAERRVDESLGAEELARVLRATGASLDVYAVRADPTTQDSASALRLVVDSPGELPEIGQAVAGWLRRRPIYKLTVQTDDGTIRGLLDAASGADLAERVITVLAGSRLNRVITGTGNVITGGVVSGVVPEVPWPEPKKPSR